MIEPGEQTRHQRMRDRRQRKGQCVRCGGANGRLPLTICSGCALHDQTRGRAWRAAHPGYMAAYGRAWRAAHATPSSVGRAQTVDAARDPQGVSKP